jgi:hypothetical protein
MWPQNHTEMDSLRIHPLILRIQLADLNEACNSAPATKEWGMDLVLVHAYRWLEFV